MKRSLLIVTALMLGFFSNSQASITVDNMTDPEYMINSGYSEATAEEVLIAKKRTNGQPAERLYEKDQNKFVRFWRNLYAYIDPAWDSDERIHHDIQQSPSYHDL